MAVGVSAAMNIRPRPTQAARADTCRNFIVGKEATVHKRSAALRGSLADLVRTWLRTFGRTVRTVVTVTLLLPEETEERKRVTNALP